MLKLLSVATSAVALAFCLSSGANAAQELVVKTDQTQLIDITGSPGAVVVGNPSIADATVHGSKIFVHGRAYGSTNMIILDQDGNQLAAFDITVQLGGVNNLAMYKAGVRFSYTCAPSCETALQQGDQVDWFNDVAKMGTKKSDIATGKSSGDSEVQPAAQ